MPGEVILQDGFGQRFEFFADENNTCQKNFMKYLRLISSSRKNGCSYVISIAHDSFQRKIVISKNKSSILRIAKLLDAILCDMDGLVIKCTAVNSTVRFEDSTLLVKFNDRIFDLNCNSSRVLDDMLDIIPSSFHALDILASWYPFDQYKSIYYLFHELLRNFYTRDDGSFANRSQVLKLIVRERPDSMNTQEQSENLSSNKSEVKSENLNIHDSVKIEVHTLIDGLDKLQVFIKEQQDKLSKLKLENGELIETKKKLEERCEQLQIENEILNEKHKEDQATAEDLIKIDIPMNNQTLFKYFQNMKNEKSLTYLYNTVKKHEEWLRMYDNDEKKLEQVLQTLSDSQNFFKNGKFSDTEPEKDITIDHVHEIKEEFEQILPNGSYIFNSWMENLNLEISKKDFNVCFKLMNDSDVRLPNDLSLYVESQFHGNGKQDHCDKSLKSDNCFKFEITHGINAHSYKTFIRFQKNSLTDINTVITVYITNDEGQKLMEGFKSKIVDGQATQVFRFNPVHSIEYVVNDDIISSSTELTFEDYSVVPNH